ncbi:hypothetical protein AXF41_12410 [Clostridium haemolyticum]|uniref:Uncharacterized protein n=1 Tax=Clostridium novyi B str. ATCC 27606 TaxID=1443123 RepID=A0AA40IRF7_CLONO|nr:hypothetical protein [Clostridium haemolyticum]KEI07977.1 hypothetical protein Z958_p0164 [Clostridium novyi B str. NCTC 9691]KEI11395.1 hypothetical protein Z959_p0098 [Clostridium novyi B str. ATCC 27606]OOB76397.1 hypothetical protein AXF41_12410 [Clostridium haemolyticum]
MNKNSEIFYPILGSFFLIFASSYTCDGIIYSFFNEIHICDTLFVIIPIILKSISFLGILSLIFFSILLIKQNFKNSEIFYPTLGSLFLIFPSSRRCDCILYSLFKEIHICDKLYVIIPIILKGISFLGILSLMFFSILLIKQGFKNLKN